jgi:DNA-binding MarR family transcriptional regulator
MGEPPLDSIVRIERALAELLRVASSPRLHEARQAATGSNISIAEFRFLRRIAEHGQVSVSEAASMLGVSQPTASRTLHQLAADGMVWRNSVASDGRMALYRVTPAGRREQLRLEHHMHQHLEDTLADVPSTRRAQQAALLEELVTRLHEGRHATVTA